MNVALIGSVSSSWFALDALIRSGVEVTCVLGVHESQAERISDYRSLRARAQTAVIPFRSFLELREPRVEAFLRRYAPDMLWVIGLSQLVPDRLIRLAPHGGVGFHPTMLPEGRGRAPVAWTILKGARAAANLFYLSDEPDAGDIIIQREVPVLPHDYSEDLIQRTNLALADAILSIAADIRAGTLPRTPQDHSKATYYPKRTPADGLIDWSQSTEAVYWLIRAAGRPYPGAFTFAAGRKIIIWRAEPAPPSDDPTGPAASGPRRCLPGAVLPVDDVRARVSVATGDGAIRLTEVELDGGGTLGDIVRPGAILGAPDC